MTPQRPHRHARCPDHAPICAAAAPLRADGRDARSAGRSAILATRARSLAFDVDDGQADASDSAVIRSTPVDASGATWVIADGELPGVIAVSQ